MNKIFPNYENCLTNLTSSIEKHFGLTPSHKTLEIVDDVLKNKSYKNVILVELDGFGYKLLKKHKKYCPFLYKHLKTYITSTFPSTTMAATTSIKNGLNPIEHGWMGWNMYFKEFDKIITLFTGKEKGANEDSTNYDVKNTILKYDSLVDRINCLDGYNAYEISGKINEDFSFKDNVKKAIKITKESKNNYIFLYYNEPDRAFHKNGCDSKLNKRLLKSIDKNFKKLCKKSKDSLVLATADHGHINVDYITLTDYPSIIEMLEGNVFVDLRACAFRVKEQYKEVFPSRLKEVLKEDFLILSSKEVDEKRLFGTGEKNKYYEEGLGDFFAIAIGNKAIRYGSDEHMHKSSHSGVTEDEMLVPLIIYDKEN